MFIDQTMESLTEMSKRYMSILNRRLQKNDITIIEIVSHMRYIDTELLYVILCGKLRKHLATYLLLKCEIVKQGHKYKAGDK